MNETLNVCFSAIHLSDADQWADQSENRIAAKPINRLYTQICTQTGI